MQEANHIQSAMMLEWLGQAPITIHRAFVDLTGNVLAALWLSYALDRSPKQDESGFMLIEMTSAECQKDTGITRAQQQTCRKTLVDLGILTEEGGKGRALHYRINTQRLMDLLVKQVQPLTEALCLTDKQQVAPGQLTTQAS
jgi:hypothetical protein